MRFKKLTSLLLSAACLIGSILPGMSTVSAYDGTTYKYGPLEYIITTSASGEKSIQILKCDNNVTGTVTIPSTIDGIPVRRISVENNTGAFFDCQSMTGVVIPNTVTEIGIGSFYNCTHLESVNIPGSVKTIGANAFIHCYMKSLTLNEGIKEIGSCAFWENAISTVNIPTSVEIIGNSAFHACGYLSSVYVNNPYCTIGDTDKAFAHATVYAHNGSTAQAYASKYGLAFSSIGEIPSIKYTRHTQSDHWYYNDQTSYRKIGIAAYAGSTALNSSDISFRTSPKQTYSSYTDHTAEHPIMVYVKGIKTSNIPVKVGLRGDTDENGKITAADASKAFSAYKKQYSGENSGLTPYQTFLANVDSDQGTSGSSKLSAQDASRIFSYYKEMYKNGSAQYHFLKK